MTQAGSDGGQPTSPLTREEVADLLRRVPGWKMIGNAIEREFRFPDFRDAMVFVNKVAEAAERQEHHPDIVISYNRVHLVLTTHKAGGLTRRDFALAAAIDELIRAGAAG